MACGGTSRGVARRQGQNKNNPCYCAGLTVWERQRISRARLIHPGSCGSAYSTNRVRSGDASYHGGYGGCGFLSIILDP